MSDTAENVVNHPTTHERGERCLAEHRNAENAGIREALASLGDTERSRKREMRKQQRAQDAAIASGDVAELERFLRVADKFGVATGY